MIDGPVVLGRIDPPGRAARLASERRRIPIDEDRGYALARRVDRSRGSGRPGPHDQERPMLFPSNKLGRYGSLHDRLPAKHLIADAYRENATAQIEEKGIDLMSQQEWIAHWSIIQPPPGIQLLVVVFSEGFLDLLLKGSLIERFDLCGKSAVRLVDLGLRSQFPEEGLRQVTG